MRKILFRLFSFTSFLMSISAFSENIPKLPIGMNLPDINYYVEAVPFLDLKKSSSEWITFNASGSSPWSTENLDKLERDPQGYPLEIPAKINDGPPQAVRFLINNSHPGRFRFLYSGQGAFYFSVPHVKENGETFITLDGTGENVWIDIISSKKGDHVRNIRIIPADLNGDPSVQLFNPLYSEGIKPFHCLRFMDWMRTNNSQQDTWGSRVRPDYHTQGGDNGAAIEHAIALCNELQSNAWFCVPHKADDDYIRQFAILVRDKLDPSLIVYVEYSNELWNWVFSQSQYVLKNAPGARDRYVSEDLNKINPQERDHPEKDAYMMQRVFKIWEEVFQPDQRQRLVSNGSSTTRVA